MTDGRPRLTPGRVIDNPFSGERIVILQSGADTHGQLLSFDLFLPPGGHVPATHVHPIQQERFTVLEGQMRLRVGGRSILANPGQTIVVEPGTVHWFGNVGPRTALARVEVRPALRTEELFERSGAIGAYRPWSGITVPRLPELALVLLDFQGELAVPTLPAFLVRLFLQPFAWLARRSSGSRA
jgi:quercetin dioxygenase-like cupin family protein